MPDLTLTLIDMAHGGLALGRDKSGRAIFVPFAIPGETVRVRVPDDKRGFARAELLEIVKPSPDRVMPRCRHFGICGNCHLQHMSYAAQLRAKEAAVRDQLTRVGGLKDPALRPILPTPEPYGYRAEATLFPVEGGGLGYWSPVEQRIFRVEECPILQPALGSALPDLDVELPGLRRLSLRLGDDEELLAALETEDVEPPELAVDFPGHESDPARKAEAGQYGIGGHAVLPPLHTQPIRHLARIRPARRHRRFRTGQVTS